MKKFIYPAMALAAIFSLASCSSDEPDAPVGDGATFTIRLPKDMQTRATFGDQSKVTLNNLQWTIYDVTSGTATLVTSGAKANAFATSQTEEQVTLPLVKGHTYQVTFYADNSQNNYATYTDGKVSVNYANGASNDKEEDCFVGKSTQIAVTGAFNETVTLTRPYSQLNWGTDDLDAPTVKAILTGLLANVKVNNLYQSMDVLTGEFSDPVTGDITFPNVDINALPEETFPVEGYSLIAMNYLLTGNGTVDCSLNFTNNVQSVTVNQAPVKVNYRTNIYGSLLTSPGNFNIIVDPNWEEPDLAPLTWDGTYVIPKGLETNAETLITTPQELAGLAMVVTGYTDAAGTAHDANPLTGKTIRLHNDMDLAGLEWTPVGNSTNTFQGTFLGQGKHIKGLTISKGSNAGLFGKTENATIQDLFLDNVNIKGSMSTGAAVGNATATTITNVHVSGTVTGSGFGFSHMTAMQGTGGVVGTMTYTGTIENCTSSATVNNSSRFAGGIVGVAAFTKTGQTPIQIKNCSNSGNVGTTSAGHWMGGIAGVSSADISGCTNTGVISGNNEAIGGICGEQRIYGSVTGCVNRGTVTNNSKAYGTGGIVGYVRYYYAGQNDVKNVYQQQGMITINGNTNSAAISGGNGVGGIVGIWFQYGYCNNNNNYAPTITASLQWPAGILGAVQRLDGNDYNLAEVPADAKMYIQNNLTSTTLDNITGSMKSLFFYNNIGDLAVSTGNKTTF